MNAPHDDSRVRECPRCHKMGAPIRVGYAVCPTCERELRGLPDHPPFFERRWREAWAEFTSEERGTMTNVACELCGGPTPMVHTKRCDRCWELERRLLAAPDLARQILGAVPQDETVRALEARAQQAEAALATASEELRAQKEKNAQFKGAIVFLQNARDWAISQRANAHVSNSQWDLSTSRAVAEAALAGLK